MMGYNYAGVYFGLYVYIYIHMYNGNVETSRLSERALQSISSHPRSVPWPMTLQLFNGGGGGHAIHTQQYYILGSYWDNGKENGN